MASGASLTTEVGETVLGAAYVRDENPAAVRQYFARFYIDPDSLTLSTDTQQFDHLVAYDAQGDREFLVGVTYNSDLPERRLFVTAFEDDGTRAHHQGRLRVAALLGLAVRRRPLEGVRRAPTATSRSRSTAALSSRWPPACRWRAAWPTATARSAPWSGAPRSVAGSNLGTLDMDDFDSRSSPY